MKEVWKDIPMYAGIYEVSTLGRVRSKVTNEIAKPFKNERGYMIVKIYLNGMMKNERVHRLVALTFIPNPDHLPQVNHKDYNRTNNQVTNLEWCTAEQNILYSMDNLHGKRVQCYDKVFPSVGQCCKYYNVPRTTMQNWLNGSRNMPTFYKQGNLKFC